MSPLLANVYLNELDQWIKQWTDGPKGGPENWSFVRYADDFLILTDGRRHRAEAMKEEVEEFLDEELRLKLSQKKSRLRHAESGLSFLGYDMVADSASGGCKMYVPQGAKDYIRDRIKEATDGGTDVSISLQLKSVNRVVRGWASYYKYCADAGEVFSDVNHLLWHRMANWLAERYDCSKAHVIQHKLDDNKPMRVGKCTLADLSGLSTNLTRSPRRHNHPYLNEDRDQLPDSQWGEAYRDGHPGPNPYLANKERRTGEADRVFEARLRDENTCRSVGCDTEGHRSLPVHHIRQRESPDDDRLGNLVTLCKRCHRKVHYTDQVVTVNFEGIDEPIELS